MNKYLIIVVTLLLCFNASYAQGIIGVKTNLLYGGLTYTPNLGVEFGIGKKTTIDISAGYNPWKRNNRKKLTHTIIQPEFRYFLCERFNGHFFGAHAIYTKYNIARHELPMLFGEGSKNYRFEGNGYGGGISYGYQLLLGTHWNIEFQIGAGYVRLDSDKYGSYRCSPKIESTNKNYFGITRAGISLIYIIK